MSPRDSLSLSMSCLLLLLCSPTKEQNLPSNQHQCYSFKFQDLSNDRDTFPEGGYVQEGGWNVTQALSLALG